MTQVHFITRTFGTDKKDMRDIESQTNEWIKRMTERYEDFEVEDIKYIDCDHVMVIFEI